MGSAASAPREGPAATKGDDESLAASTRTVSRPLKRRVGAAVGRDDPELLEARKVHLRWFDEAAKPAALRAAAKRITRTEVALPAPFGTGEQDCLAYVLHGLFTEQECRDVIAFSDALGFDEALLNIGGGRQVRDESVRSNLRLMVDDPELADIIHGRLAPHLPTRWEAFGRPWRSAGHLNERLRILRYTPGQRFKPHYDGCYVRDRMGCALRGKEGDTSMITIQLYLNTVEGGGETNFLAESHDGGVVGVTPAPGDCLIFEHRILHEGAPVTAGVKYTIRTDLMFTPADDGEEPEMGS